MYVVSVLQLLLTSAPWVSSLHFCLCSCHNLHVLGEFCICCHVYCMLKNQLASAYDPEEHLILFHWQDKVLRLHLGIYKILVCCFYNYFLKTLSILMESGLFSAVTSIHCISQSFQCHCGTLTSHFSCVKDSDCNSLPDCAPPGADSARILALHLLCK